MYYCIHFSPTGATRKAAEILCGGLSEQFETIDLMKKCDFSKKFCPEDVCVIAAPAYGGIMPAGVGEKLSQMDGNGAKAVMVASFGTRAIDDTLIQMMDILSRGGFLCVAGVEAVTEHSLCRSFGSGRPNGDDKQELLKFAEQIKTVLGRQTPVENIPGNIPWKTFPGSPAKPVATDACTECGLCAAECPADAISTDCIREVNKEKCISCMHCVVICPHGARQVPAEIQAGTAVFLKGHGAGHGVNKLYI